MSKGSDMWDFNRAKKEKLAWFILDEIAVKHSATHSGETPPYKSCWGCPICDRAEEAMKLLTKPTHDECGVLYEKRKNLLINQGQF